MTAPENDRSRPGGGGVPVERLLNQDKPIATDSREPRNAGCPTLHVELYRNTARLYGARVLQLLDEVGVAARMYDRAHGCWSIPVQFADDVICLAEYRQRRFVTVAEVEA